MTSSPILEIRAQQGSGVRVCIYEPMCICCTRRWECMRDFEHRSTSDCPGNLLLSSFCSQLLTLNRGALGRSSKPRRIHVNRIGGRSTERLALKDHYNICAAFNVASASRGHRNIQQSSDADRMEDDTGTGVNKASDMPKHPRMISNCSLIE